MVKVKLHPYFWVLASKEEMQFSLVDCYPLARDMCWSEAILYSTRFTNSYRVEGGSYGEIRGGITNMAMR